MFLEYLIKVYCYSNGIILNKKYEKYEIYLFSALMTNSVILIIGLLKAFLRSPTVIYKLEICAVWCCVIAVFFFKILARLHKNQILDIISILRKDSIFNATCILTKLNLKMKTTFLPLIMVTVFSFATLFNATFLFFVIKSEIDYNDPDFYVIPYLFHFFEIHSFKGYLFYLWLQTALLFPEMIAYLCMCNFACYTTASILVSVDEFAIHAKNSVYCIHKIERRLKSRNIKLRENLKSDDKKVTLAKIFDDLIKFQNDIYRYLNTFMIFGKWIFNIMLLWFFSNLVLFGFLFTQFTGNEVLKFKCVIVLVNLGSVFYIACYIGGILSEINESMLASFYDTSWMNLTPYNRKSMLTFMIQSQRKIHVKPFNMFILNLELFGKTIRIVYSIINALIVAQPK